MDAPRTRRPHKHPRPQTSCTICHRRKVKCNRLKPCDQCISRNQTSECVYDAEKLGPLARLRSSASSLELSTAANLPEAASSLSSTGGSASSGVFSDAEPPLGSSGNRSSIQTRVDPPSRGTWTLAPPSTSATLLDLAGSKVPTHDWDPNGHERGRSYSAWSIQLFQPLIAFFDTGDTTSVTTRHIRHAHEIAPINAVYLLWRKQRLEAKDDTISSRLSHELPSLAVTQTLVTRYLESFHLIFPVLDVDSFTRDLDSFLQHPQQEASLFLTVQVLLVIALANATYAPSNAPIPRQKCFAWMDLASTVPTTALELGECNLDAMRVIALLNNAKQVLKFNETADYIYSGAGVRFAMMIGLDRTACQAASQQNQRRLWNTVRELDLHACVACGAAPTLPPFTDVDLTNPEKRKDAKEDNRHNSMSAQGLSVNELQEILQRSLVTRIKITTLVNTTQRLRFEDVMALSRQLAEDMQPISETATSTATGHHWGFVHQYVAFVYHKFLVTLHRPFASLQHTGFHLSQEVTQRRAQSHYRAVCEAFRNSDVETDPFAALIAGNGVMFRVEAIQSAMWLSFELYRRSHGSDEEMEDYDSYIPGFGKAAVEKENAAIIGDLLRDGVVFAEAALRTHELAGLAFLIPSLVLAHLRVCKRARLGSEQYLHEMRGVAEDLSAKFRQVCISSL